MKSSKGFTSPPLAVLIILTACFLLYLDSLNFPLLWDDQTLIVENRFVQGLDPVKNIFTSHFGKGIETELEYFLGYYRPVTTLSFLANFLLGKNEPAAYHLVSILLHLLNVFLLYLLMSRWVDSPSAFFAALFFGIHPIHAEAVSYVSSRGDLLCACFMMLGFTLFLRWRETPRGFLWGGMALCFLFSLFSKETAVIFPFLLLSFSLCFRSSLWKRELLGEAALFLLLGGYGLFRIYWIPLPPGIGDASGLGWRLFSTAPLFFSYLKLLIWPYPLYTGRTAFGLGPGDSGVAYAGTLFSWAVLISLVWLIRRHRRVLFALLWIFVGSLPVLNLFPGIYPSMAEHYFYFPSMGFFGLLGAVGYHGYQRISQEGLRRALRAGCIGAVLVLGTLTVLRSGEFRSPFVFYHAMLKQVPDDYRARNNLGTFYLRKGMFQEAEQELTEAVRLNPRSSLSPFNLGTLYFLQGNYPKALSQFDQAIALTDGRSTFYRLWRAYALFRLNRVHEAEEELAEVTKDPRFQDETYFLQGQMEKFSRAREEMVASQIRRRGIWDERVLEAMRQVPRHRFVPERLQQVAYKDGPLPIGEGQTISQPYIVALMTELLELEGNEKVLEIGTGSGYQAAVLAEIVPEVYTIEILPALSEKAGEVLTKLGYDHVHLRVGNGYLGWPEEAPFDAVVVTAAPEFLPRALVDQLREGGVLVIPMGPEGRQVLWQIRKTPQGLHRKTVLPVRFVPLVEPVGEAIPSDSEMGYN